MRDRSRVDVETRSAVVWHTFVSRNKRQPSTAKLVARSPFKSPPWCAYELLTRRPTPVPPGGRLGVGAGVRTRHRHRLRGPVCSAGCSLRYWYDHKGAVAPVQEVLANTSLAQHLLFWWCNPRPCHAGHADLAPCRKCVRCQTGSPNPKLMDSYARG